MAPPSPYSRSRSRAFTLVELCVVAGLVTGVVLTGSWLRGPRSEAVARSTAHRLAFTMHLARARAIVLRHTVYVDFAPRPFTPADGLYTVWIDLDDDRVPDPDEHVAAQVPLGGVVGALPVERLPQGVRFGGGGLEKGPGGSRVFPDGISFSGGVDRVGFHPSGAASAGTCYLEGDRGGPVVWALRTTRPGEIQTWSWLEGAWRRRS